MERLAATEQSRREMAADYSARAPRPIPARQVTNQPAAHIHARTLTHPTTHPHLASRPRCFYLSSALFDLSIKSAHSGHGPKAVLFLSPSKDLERVCEKDIAPKQRHLPSHIAQCH